MEKQKLNPLQRVICETADHSELSAEEIDETVRDLLQFLQDRSAKEIELDLHSDSARTAARQYRVFCEIILTFGSQLIAFDDIEIDSPEEGTN